MIQLFVCFFDIGWWGLFFLGAVVVQLDDDDDDAGDGGYHVGDEQWPVACEGTLYDEEDAAEAEHDEGGHGDGVGLAGLDGVIGLGYVAAYHADGGGCSDYVNP